MPDPGAELPRDRQHRPPRHPELRGAAPVLDAGNLQASCGACNYAGAAYMTRDNRRAIIERNQHLEHVVKVQEERIEELAAALAHCRKGLAPEPKRPRQIPAIHRLPAIHWPRPPAAHSDERIPALTLKVSAPNGR